MLSGIVNSSVEVQRRDLAGPALACPGVGRLDWRCCSGRVVSAKMKVQVLGPQPGSATH